PIAVETDTDDTVYLRVETEPTSVLLRGSSAGDPVEILRKDGTKMGPGIGGVSVAGDNGGTLFIATSEGLYASAGGAPPVKSSSLGYARCAVRHGTELYACSWNYPPDSAAVARSDDDGKSFTKVFQ